MENNFENLTIGVFAKAAGVNVRSEERRRLLKEEDSKVTPAIIQNGFCYIKMTVLISSSSPPAPFLSVT